MPKILDPKSLPELNYKNYPAENLTEGVPVFVKGRIAFSRIATLLEGESLMKSIASAKARGQRYPTDRPHTTLLIEDPVIVYTGDTPSYNDLAIANRCYISKEGKNAGKMLYGQDNVGQLLPVALSKNENGTFNQVILEGEPANGIEVMIAVSIYKSSAYEKRGTGIAQIYFLEPLSYYNNSGVSDTVLNALGITVEGPIRGVTSEEVKASGIVVDETRIEEEFAQTTGPGTVVTPEGYAMPDPAGIDPVVVAPVAPPTPAPAAPVAAPATTQDQQIALLQQQLAAAQAQAAGGASAFTTPATPAAPASTDPWTPTGPGIGFPTN